MSVYEITLLLNGEKDREERIREAFDRVVARNGAALQRLADSDKQPPTLTETDLIANLAQEVASLKKDLHRITGAVIDAQSDIADLEDRLDENEKDTEEVIGRINDLGVGAEAAAVSLDELITELEALRTKENDFSRALYDHGDRVNGQYRDGVASGIHIAITRIKEALRNG